MKTKTQTKTKTPKTAAITTAFEAVAAAREDLDAIRGQLDKADERLREAVRTLVAQAGILPDQ